MSATKQPRAAYLRATTVNRKRGADKAAATRKTKA